MSETSPFLPGPARRAPVRLIWSLLALLAGAAAPTPASAAAFFIQEQSATGVGRANAGATAIANDTSTIFFNPAGMTELPGPAISVAGHLIFPQVSVENRGSTARGRSSNRPFVFSGSDGKTSETAAVGNVYAAAPIWDGRVWLGLGVTAPFGLATKYDERFFARYDSLESSLLTVNVSPAIATMVVDWLSVGFGLDFQYAKSTFIKAVPNPLAAHGLTPDTDGRSKLEGKDWSVGYNVGALIKIAPGTRLGVHYRSSITHDLDGVAETSGFRGTLGALNDTRAGSAQLKLPAVLSLGVAHDISSRLLVLGQFWYFGWDRFDKIRVDFDGSTPDQVFLEGYRPTLAASIGAEYQVDNQWTLRSGFQYDQTPTTDDFRTTRVPDGDRFWLSFGASYRLNETLSFDASYAHIFIRDTAIDRTDSFFHGTPLAVTTRTRGKIAGSSADILSLQLRLSF